MICIAGDSIALTVPGSNGTAGAYSESMWPWIIRRRMNLRGLAGQCRIINKAFGGSRIIHGQVAIDEGFYDVPYDLMIVAYGINDASLAATDQATYQAAMQAYIDHRDMKRPNAEIIFCGPVNSTDVTRLYGAGVQTGTAQAVSATTLTLSSGASAVDGAYIGKLAGIVSATTGAGQGPLITGYVGATKVATFSGWPDAITPTGTISYAILDPTVTPDNLANVRAWTSAKVTSAGGSARGLYYCDQSASYTSGQVATYSGDGKVHPNIAGHGLVATTTGNVIATTKFYLGGGLSAPWIP